jgi:hypothetical protein
VNIWILDSKRGITLLNRSYLDLPVKDDLVSGLLTALNQFTLVEFNQPIDSIDMGGFMWIYDLDPEFNLLFVIADTKEAEAETLRSRLQFIKNLFIKRFVHDKEHWQETWNGDLDRFKEFGEIIDNYYANWVATENIDMFADFFDLIGVFQQLLNLVKNVILNQIDRKKKEKILAEIEEFFNKFKNRMDILKSQELSKISYSSEAGFNIFNINPTNCDVLFVRKVLKDLLVQVIHIIKDKLGHDLSLNYFSEFKIFNYVFNNMTLLKRLKLEGFLLQLFLLK